LDNPGESRIEVPIVHGGQRLGSVTVAMAPGHPLRAREHRLITDLADQAGLVFRNARLAAELSGEIEQLRRHTDELARSRVRLINASDAEQSRLELAIAGQVIPHLEALPDRLHQLSHPAAADAEPVDAADLKPLIVSVAAALAALREITRGVFPGQLARSGLPSALRSLLAQPNTQGQLLVDDSDANQRFDPRVEAAAYFCVAQLTRELGPPFLVNMAVLANELSIHVSGNDTRSGMRRGHMTDRVEAAGGSIAVTTANDRTVVKVSLPLPIGGRTR
jgi:hypothetical protein